MISTGLILSDVKGKRCSHTLSAQQPVRVYPALPLHCVVYIVVMSCWPLSAWKRQQWFICQRFLLEGLKVGLAVNMVEAKAVDWTLPCVSMVRSLLCCLCPVLTADMDTNKAKTVFSFNCNTRVRFQPQRSQNALSTHMLCSCLCLLKTLADTIFLPSILLFCSFLHMKKICAAVWNVNKKGIQWSTLTREWFNILERHVQQ